MAIPRSLVESARRAVLQKFPEMAGMRCSGEAAPAPGKYIVTARRTMPTKDGRALQRVVRVTLDSTGRVLRLSASK
jgi:hypothetical protein